MALKYSPGCCLKLKYRYLLKADNVPGDTSGGTIFGHNLNKLGRGLLGDTTYQIPWLWAL